MIFFLFSRKNGLHESLYCSQKNGHDPYGCVRMTFLSGVRCAPAFFERCGRFAKNCVCSRLHSPQRLTRLCGCCDEPHFCFRKNGLHESLYHSQKKRTRPIRVCPYDFLSGVRCAPAFFERCGRFAKNCVCSRLHSPQRLTRLCGCCDEPHFCFRKNGLHESLYHSQKKRTRPIRVCPYDFLSGVRCAPAFFERCGRFAKNCVCSRLHSPQRLTRLCGCCDEPHFCYAKTGFMNPCIAIQKRTRPIRVCPYGLLYGVRCVSQNFDR